MDATGKFTGRSSTYAQYRPSYPREYLDYLAHTCRLTADSVAADIGSGTGILTQQLLELGIRVLAVEPNADMRKTAEAALGGHPGFVSVSGAAEHTGIDEHNLDLITVAQAFHWFDPVKFKQECRRILKADAPVALVWNSRVPSSDIVAENAVICRKYCPAFTGFSGGIDETPDIYAAFFRDGLYEYREFANDLVFDLDQFVGRNLSASYAPTPQDASYSEFVEALHALYDKYREGNRLIMPNVVRSYVGRV